MSAEVTDRGLEYRFATHTCRIGFDDLDSMWVVRGRRSALISALVAASIVSLCVALPALFVLGPVTGLRSGRSVWIFMVAVMIVAYGSALAVGWTTRRATLDVMARFAENRVVGRVYTATDEADLGRFLDDVRRARPELVR